VLTATVQNDGTAAERLSVGGPGTLVNGYRLTYKVGATDVTSRMIAGDYVTPLLQPGATTTIQVRVRLPRQPRGRVLRGLLEAYSYSNLRAGDAVRFVVQQA
jgi:hypothetical protein